MKKIILLFLVSILAMALLVGCAAEGDGEETPVDNVQEEEVQEAGEDDHPLIDANFEEKDGLLVYTDTENGPFEEAGLKISIHQGDQGYAEFIKTDLEGNETEDYYKFDYEENIMEKYYYVSAMGTAFYYYYDLEAEELVKVEDGDNEDSTESLKSAGRWDSAVESTEEDMDILEEYFESQYNMTIKEAVLGK